MTATRVWRPGRPVDLRATLGPLVRGGGDPTAVMEAAGLWRTARTPVGPGTLHLRVDAAEGVVHGTAWGDGADWLLETLPDLLGASDVTAEEFDPDHPVVRGAWRRHPGWRVPRSRRVWETLVPTVLEQKVTGGEARDSWWRLVHAYGDPAPGPEGLVPARLRVVPSPETWARIPSWEWHRAGVGPERARTLVGAASRAVAIERTLDLPLGKVEAALRALPGVGAWTAAEVRQRAHGDPDAVSVGDVHLAGQVVFALTGDLDGDDARMLELLEPWVGHRYRVVRMIELSGVSRPRRGPRYAPLDHRGR
ncbi:MAG TPA: DNA-3-methyladenine glycosylase 2 family protein [Candidatus Limnocylindria bacterium]|nr:DNA-3-methyladenine glycosylase 2 family protein [Candidatus Limnocylindria bacterium]